MAPSHQCGSCGRDLARVRPVADPDLGPGLVACPACGARAMRRRPPGVRAWRRTNRAAASLRLLIVQALAAALLTGLTFGAAIFVRDAFFDLGAEDRWWAAIAPFLLLPSLLGIWLTAGLGHVRRWLAWVGWMAWMLATATAVEIFRALILLGDRLELVSRWGGGPTLDLDVGGLWTAVAGYTAVELVMAILLGVPVGLIGRRIGRAIRSAGWRRRRRARETEAFS